MTSQSLPPCVIVFVEGDMWGNFHQFSSFFLLLLKGGCGEVNGVACCCCLVASARDAYVCSFSYATVEQAGVGPTTTTISDHVLNDGWLPLQSTLLTVVWTEEGVFSSHPFPFLLRHFLFPFSLLFFSVICFPGYIDLFSVSVWFFLFSLPACVKVLLQSTWWSVVCLFVIAILIRVVSFCWRWYFTEVNTPTL